MSWFRLPVQRPVATSMLFAAIVLLGVIGWQKIPVELFPGLAGDQLYVSFFRPGSEPEVVEREILLPLEARVSELPGMEESWGEVRGSGGNVTVRFEPGTDIKVRELEIQRLAAELTRAQPQGTAINVNAQDLAMLSRFVMIVQVAGGEDIDALHTLVDERIQPRLAAVTGVSSVLTGGGAPLEITVRVDPERCAAMGITPPDITASLARSVQRLTFLGGLEDETGRTAVILDGRPRGVRSLGESRVVPNKPVLVHHVAEVDYGTGREDLLFRINGKPSVGLIVFQEEGANLVSLGRELRDRLEELRTEYSTFGIEFVMGFDAAELVEKQIDRLKKLGLSGFLIALVVLFLFLRHLQAVSVVAVAVPVSLLAALALLFVGNLSLNLITLFGLAVGIGMLVDNSIVVYEAVQRQLEHGASPDEAAAEGIRRTVRAIVAATATTAIVFLPIAYAAESTMVRGLLNMLATAILLPLASSLLVAVGLVPLLARRLAAPAAISRLHARKNRRESFAGLVLPDRGRELFSGFLKVALRRPALWLVVVFSAVIFTVIVALPLVVVMMGGEEPREADEVRLTVDVPRGESLDAIKEGFASLEKAALDLEGVEYVESVIQEDSGSLTVKFEEKDKRPEDLTAPRVRKVLRDAAEALMGFNIRTAESSGSGGSERGGGTGSLFGTGPAEIVLSGPDVRKMTDLATAVKDRLESVPEIGRHGVWISGRGGQAEIRVTPDEFILTQLGLSPDQVLPALSLIRREGTAMRTGFILTDGREIPLTVRIKEDQPRLARRKIEDLRLSTPIGVMSLGALAEAHKMPPPPTIFHHNGRREVSVYYRFNDRAPGAGPARQALEEQILSMVRDVHRPAGYTVEAQGEDESTSWFKRVLVPIILLLFAVLAVTFESLTLPVLVLLAVPLTILGATWALVLSGMSADMMALVGAVALLGLTVNPAILLVDRMQQRARRQAWTAGAAALAAVRERTRPVLMTTCTTIAGLWPLALATGRENEIWPSFATVVMGGLATSTLLTLLVIPVGFVFLNRLDRLFGRLGPWVVIAWAGATVAVMAPLIMTEWITSTTWQITTTVLVAGGFLGLAVLLFRWPEAPEPASADGPPAVEARFLRKIYGQHGPIGRAWHIGEHFAERVLARGGSPFVPRDARPRIFTLAVVLLGVAYLALSLTTMWWRLVFSFAGAVLLCRLLVQIRRFRGKCDKLGRADPGGPETLLAFLVPWVVLVLLTLHYCLIPMVGDQTVRLVPAAVVLVATAIFVVQLGRSTAKRLSAGALAKRVEKGLLRRTRTLWRRVSGWIFGLDLPREEIEALTTIHFRSTRGMVGILGPNGAGKTTLLRLLAGILDPSTGTVFLGGVSTKPIRHYLARWVGYLPQDFGLPMDLTAREYLEYYALLYNIGNRTERRSRINLLLDEVGLAANADKKIGGYSGGMRQRAAVARTLLRLPPVIIVDEPTVGLDPRERIRFRNLLGQLSKTRVVLFSTHVVEDVAVACERVIVLARGSMVFDGRPSLLAGEAAGRVWVARLNPEEEARLPEDALIVDQVPETDGASRVRILCEQQPHPDAYPADPTLEDGYLRLVGFRGGKRTE